MQIAQGIIDLDLRVNILTIQLWYFCTKRFCISLQNINFMFQKSLSDFEILDWTKSKTLGDKDYI